MVDEQYAAFLDAGFMRCDWPLPSGTRYARGELFVRLSQGGMLRAFCPTGSTSVELSTGSLYEPVVHYTGPLPDAAALRQLAERFQP